MTRLRWWCCVVQLAYSKHLTPFILLPKAKLHPCRGLPLWCRLHARQPEAEMCVWEVRMIEKECGANCVKLLSCVFQTSCMDLFFSSFKGKRTWNSSTCSNINTNCNVLVDAEQHGHSDWSAATQHTQQAVVHYMYWHLSIMAILLNLVPHNAETTKWR